MKRRLTISYFDHFIHFIPAEMEASASIPSGCMTCSDEELDKAFDLLQQKKDVTVFYSHGFNRIASYLFTHYRYVKAAGGLVQDAEGNRLLIYREGNWDIPKGMVEAGESHACAAVREVAEETGITDIHLDSLLLKTYHIYDKYGGWHLKQTSWYRMHTTQRQSTIPQTEEGITQAVWVPMAQCKALLSTSFATLRIVSKEI